jgi:hypothetical protein
MRITDMSTGRCVVLPASFSMVGLLAFTSEALKQYPESIPGADVAMLAPTLYARGYWNVYWTAHDFFIVFNGGGD